MLAEFTTHSDSIACIDFFEKDDRIFILTASSDCSVALSDLHGNTYGIFGQPNQWRVDVDLSKLREDEARLLQAKIEQENEDENPEDTDVQSHLTFSQDLDSLSHLTDEEILTRRSNVWNSTSIGTNILMKYWLKDRRIFLCRN